MKLLSQLVLLTYLTVASLNSFAQTIKETSDERVYMHVQYPPHFPGGEQTMLKFLADSLRYPELAKREEMEGLVVVKFVVNKDGTRSDYVTMQLNNRPQHEVFHAEALRLAKSMPNWVPGKQNCETVRVQYMLPIRFSLKPQAPSQTNSAEKPAIPTTADQMPAFPGGEDALKSFLENNLKYPKKARKSKIQGAVNVRFVVQENGQLTNFTVVKSLEPTLDAEALRVVQLMPAWQPGLQCGQPIKVKYTLPVRFSL